MAEAKLRYLILEVQEELLKRGFKYGQGHDCQEVAKAAKEKGPKFELDISVEYEKKRMLVSEGAIIGSDKTFNTSPDGLKMWFFHEHYWCKSGDMDFDPLFGRVGKPEMDIETTSMSHRGLFIYVFESGKCVALDDGDGAAFNTLDEAKAHIEKKTPDYDPDDNWDESEDDAEKTQAEAKSIALPSNYFSDDSEIEMDGLADVLRGVKGAVKYLRAAVENLQTTMEDVANTVSKTSDNNNTKNNGDIHWA